MKYPYIVKRNGVYYEAGQDVPALAPVKEKVIESTEEEDNESAPVEEEKHTYTKTEINRTDKKTLAEMAKKIGIENADELSGNVLKDKLIEYYNL